MRVSIFVGLASLAIGIFLSYLATALIATQTMGGLQTTAMIVAIAIFVIFSATMLGAGAAYVLHWIIGFANPLAAFILEMILSFALFFVGLGATVMTGELWLGLQLFFTFFIGSATLFFLSFVTMFGGVFQGIQKITAYVGKKFKRGKSGTAKVRRKKRRVR